MKTKEDERVNIAESYGVKPDEILEVLEKERRVLIYDNEFFRFDSCHTFEENEMNKYEPFRHEEKVVADEAIKDFVKERMKEESLKRKRGSSTKTKKTKRVKSE